MSDSCNTLTFYNLVISNMFHICSISFSHPLYFSYFIFLSPHLIELATFLSRFFVTVSLIFLALLTSLTTDNFPDAIEEKRPERDDGGEEDFDHGLEDLQIYESLFGLSEKAEEPPRAVEKQSSESTQRRFFIFPPPDYDLGTYGSSVREEKEWSSTLACKMFEEKRNLDGDKEMDSLWETYEKNDLRKSKAAENAKTKKKKKMKRDEVDGGELGEVDVQAGCLRALRFSSSFVRMSKAIKGIGWTLNRKKRHSKKLHNNGD